MAQITDQEVIRFNNEYIRPLAEYLEALDATMQIVKDRYLAQIAPLVSGNASGDTIEDGRASEGVSRMTLGDIQGFASLVNSLLGVFDTAGVRDTMRKPGVRKVRAVIE